MEEHIDMVYGLSGRLHILASRVGELHRYTTLEAAQELLDDVDTELGEVCTQLEQLQRNIQSDIVSLVEGEGE